MSSYEKLDMKKGSINNLLEKIKGFYSSINFSEIANLNFDNPPESFISKTSREWLLFESELSDFIHSYSDDLDLHSLEMARIYVSNIIYKKDIVPIEVELSRIERMLEKKEAEKPEESITIKSNKKIFISHSSLDIEYIKQFIQLLEDIGLEEKSIFCSSLREYGIPIGKDIFDHLKDEFKDNELIVMFMLSDNYYRSAICLNEMGAAWILQSMYYSILLPGFNFTNMKGSINPNRIGIKLDGEDLKACLNDLKNELCSEFEVKIGDNKWERARDNFINKMTQEFERNKQEITEALSKKTGTIDIIKYILSTEIESNLKRIASIHNSIGGQTFNFLDILNTIDDSNFSSDFYQPLIINLDHQKYDEYERDLVSNGTKEALEIIDLYSQFKLWNDKGDLHNFSNGEYSKFRGILLKEFNKYLT